MDPSKDLFIMVIILQIPSFLCTLYIFLRYTYRTSPLRRFQNHVLMYLLLVATWTTTIELSSTQKYLWSGSAMIYTSWFCYLWNISFFSTVALNRVLMAFMCIERHFLVFHPQFYRTRRSRLFFHYTPVILLISIILIYVFVTNLFISCTQLNFNYSFFMCGYTCAILIDNLGTAYIWATVFIPTVVTAIGCILLPARFIIQKRQLQQVDWQRARKLIVQTSVIASVYSICWLSYTIILQLALNDIVSFSNADIARFLAVLPYMTSLLTPLIIYHTVRRPTNAGILERLKRLFVPQRQGIVHPINNFVAQQQNPLATEKHTSSKRMKIVQKTSGSLPLNVQ